MILVTGGRASGRRAYVSSLGFREYGFASASELGLAGTLACDAAVVTDVADLVLTLPEPPSHDGKAAGDDDLERLLEALCMHAVVICDEVGSGVVPMTHEARVGRERVGRLAILLAARAESVVRCVCGIPCVLRGPDPAAGRLAPIDSNDSSKEA